MIASPVFPYYFTSYHYIFLQQLLIIYTPLSLNYLKEPHKWNIWQQILKGPLNPHKIFTISP